MQAFTEQTRVEGNYICRRGHRCSVIYVPTDKVELYLLDILSPLCEECFMNKEIND